MDGAQGPAPERFRPLLECGKNEQLTHLAEWMQDACALLETISTLPGICAVTSAQASDLLIKLNCILPESTPIPHTKARSSSTASQEQLSPPGSPKRTGLRDRASSHARSGARLVESAIGRLIHKFDSSTPATSSPHGVAESTKRRKRRGRRSNNSSAAASLECSPTRTPQHRPAPVLQNVDSQGRVREEETYADIPRSSSVGQSYGNGRSRPSRSPSYAATDEEVEIRPRSQSTIARLSFGNRRATPACALQHRQSSGDGGGGGGGGSTSTALLTGTGAEPLSSTGSVSSSVSASPRRPRMLSSSSSEAFSPSSSACHIDSVPEVPRQAGSYSEHLATDLTPVEESSFSPQSANVILPAAASEVWSPAAHASRASPRSARGSLSSPVATAVAAEGTARSPAPMKFRPSPHTQHPSPSPRSRTKPDIKPKPCTTTYRQKQASPAPAPVPAPPPPPKGPLRPGLNHAAECEEDGGDYESLPGADFVSSLAHGEHGGAQTALVPAQSLAHEIGAVSSTATITDRRASNASAFSAEAINHLMAALDQQQYTGADTPCMSPTTTGAGTGEFSEGSDPDCEGDYVAMASPRPAFMRLEKESNISGGFTPPLRISPAGEDCLRGGSEVRQAMSMLESFAATRTAPGSPPSGSLPTSCSQSCGGFPSLSTAARRTSSACPDWDRKVVKCDSTVSTASRGSMGAMLEHYDDFYETMHTAANHGSMGAMLEHYDDFYETMHAATTQITSPEEEEVFGPALPHIREDTLSETEDSMVYEDMAVSTFRRKSFRDTPRSESIKFRSSDSSAPAAEPVGGVRSSNSVTLVGNPLVPNMLATLLIGTLQKRSSTKKWRTRFCTLEPYRFIYGSRPHPKLKEMSSIPLFGYTVEHDLEAHKLAFRLYHPTKRVFVFKGADQDDLRHWVALFRHVTQACGTLEQWVSTDLMASTKSTS